MQLRFSGGRGVRETTKNVSLIAFLSRQLFLSKQVRNWMSSGVQGRHSVQFQSCSQVERPAPPEGGTGARGGVTSKRLRRSRGHWKVWPWKITVPLVQKSSSQTALISVIPFMRLQLMFVEFILMLSVQMLFMSTEFISVQRVSVEFIIVEFVLFEAVIVEANMVLFIFVLSVTVELPPQTVFTKSELITVHGESGSQISSIPSPSESRPRFVTPGHESHSNWLRVNPSL